MSEKSRYVFDIEANGLYHNATKVHCIRAYDLDTGVMHRFDEFNEPLFRGIKLINEAEELIGHNIIGFDIPLLHKLFPKFTNWKTIKVFDTIIGSGLIMGSLVEADSGRAKAGNLPPKLIGNHGLGAWGYRLGEYKGEYGAKIEGETEEEYVERVWSKGSQEMYDYCEQDVLVNVKLYNYLQGQKIKRGTPERALEIEHKFAKLISRQERHGVLFNYNEAVKLEETMRLESVKALDTLMKSYKPKWFLKTIAKPQTTWVEIDYDYAKEYIVPKCDREVVNGVTMFTHPNGAVYRVHNGQLQHKAKLNKANRKAKILTLTGKEITTTNALAGSVSSPIELLEFSPTSGRHIVRWLKDMFDWQPSEFTDKGTPKTDADTLGSLTFNGIEELQRYQLISKRLSQLSDAKGSLLKKYNKENGRIYGRCNTLGAVTRRCTHSSPNLAQIPAGKHDDNGFVLGIEGNGWGNEFRDLFIVPENYLMVGADGSGLELRTLAHYLYLFDEGEYAKIVLDGDIHTKNQEDAGLPTRNNAKTFIYAFLYGAGDVKIGEIVEPNASMERKKKLGASLKKKFMENNKALKSLITAIKERAGERKFVYDLDGNKLFIRSTHSAPNMLLQSCGAIVMKYWAVEVDDVLQEMGYENSDDVLHTDRTHDYENVLNIHDEAQLEAKKEIAEEVAMVQRTAFNNVGRELKMNIRIDGEAKIGSSWKYTH